MLWEIEIRPRGADPERARVAEEYDLLTHSRDGTRLVAATSRGYLLEGDQLSHEQVNLLARELLIDSVVESGRVAPLGEPPPADLLATVLLKPGVMDPAALSVVEAARDLGVRLAGARTFRRYFGPPGEQPLLLEQLRRVLANDAIEQVVIGPLRLEHVTLGRPYEFSLRMI